MQVQANGIAIEAETHGRQGDPAILLVNGYTSQLITWPKALIDGLVGRGYFVICFDNRDVGLSQKFPEGGTPKAVEVAKAVRAGETPQVPYTLADMAADGIGVLNALGIDRAHICGMSMGGMIVQNMAIHFPERLLSMTSIMSTTGNPSVPPATDEAQAALNAPPPSPARPDVIAHGIKGRRTYESPAYRKSDADNEELIGAAFDRMYYPEGYARQYAAILADGNRVPRLKSVTVPTLVIHGRDDNLVRVEGGIDTAQAIPGARLEIIEGMGHDLPVALCPRYVTLIADHADAAGRRAAAE